MPLEGLRWSRDSGSALYDTPQNGRSRTGWGGGNFANVLSANKKSNIIAQYLIMFFSFCLSLSPIRTYANVAIKNRTRKKKQQNMGAFSLFRPIHPY